MQYIGPRSNRRYLALTLAGLLLAGAASEMAFARSGRSAHFGSRHSGGSRMAVGVILVAPAFRYFPAPIILPGVATAPIAPPVYYIERGDGQQPASDNSAGDGWYYCAESKAYYPHVKECAQEWQRVSTEPPASR
jgi:hypothetical protein